MTREKEGGIEGEKQRKAFISVSQNLLRLYVRVQAAVGRAGERGAGEMAGRSMVAFFPSCGHTHPRTRTRTHGNARGIPPREYPSEVTQPAAALSHQCPKTGERRSVSMTRDTGGVQYITQTGAIRRL